MNEIWLILHLLAFGAAVTSSIANGVILMMLRESPGDAPVLSKVTPRLARVGQAGLGLLWITGLIMVWSVFGGPQNLPTLFWWKFLCVVIITVLVGMMGMIVRQMQAGDRSGMARLPLFGGATAVLLLLTVIFAVYAFD
ncbi:MAG TPA: hypothetical protein VHA70_12420 [Bauldia sp.]|nr:hypothetical protein [Bauldia sp.]